MPESPTKTDSLDDRYYVDKLSEFRKDFSRMHRKLDLLTKNDQQQLKDTRQATQASPRRTRKDIPTKSTTEDPTTYPEVGQDIENVRLENKKLKVSLKEKIISCGIEIASQQEEIKRLRGEALKSREEGSHVELLQQQMVALRELMKSQSESHAKELSRLVSGADAALLESYRTQLDDVKAELCLAVEAAEYYKRRELSNELGLIDVKSNKPNASLPCCDRCNFYKSRQLTQQRDFEDKILDSRLLANQYKDAAVKLEIQVAELSAALKDISLSYKVQISSLNEAIQVYKARCDKLAHINATQKEGFQSDVALLKKRTSSLEKLIYQMQLSQSVNRERNADVMNSMLKVISGDSNLLS